MPAYFRQRQTHADPSTAGGFGDLGTGVLGTLTFWTAGRSGRGGRSCLGCWLHKGALFRALRTGGPARGDWRQDFQPICRFQHSLKECTVAKSHPPNGR